MTVYIGVDFHARQQTISYLTTEDGEIRGLQLEHGQPETIRAFYEQFAGQQVVVGFESSGYAAWFEELLEELGCEIWIGHATAIRLFARRRQKNDRRDADLILDLLVRGDFPRIHRYSRPVEDSSGERRRIGSISKQGSRLLRFYLVEAGQIAIRRDQDLARVYKRILLRRGHATAKVAVGRRLLVRAFIMLRDEIDYAEFQRRGVAARSAR